MPISNSGWLKLLKISALESQLTYILNIKWYDMLTQDCNISFIKKYNIYEIKCYIYIYKTYIKHIYIYM